MQTINLDAAADAVIHTYEMFQVGIDGGIRDEEFRYCCAEEVETINQPWAKPLGEAIRRRIDQQLAE